MKISIYENAGNKASSLEKYRLRTYVLEKSGLEKQIKSVIIKEREGMPENALEGNYNIMYDAFVNT